MKKNTFVLYFLFVCQALLAQPADYYEIQRMFKLPDKIISLEFNEDLDGLLTYNLTLSSKKKVEELAQKFKSIGLIIASIKYTQKNRQWSFFLKKLNDNSLVDLNLFTKLLNQPWQTVENGLSILLSISEQKVFCEYSKVEQLGKNVKIAHKLDMKISDSIAHKNSSVAIFAKHSDIIDALPSDLVHEDSIAMFLSEFGKLITNSSLTKDYDYGLEIRFDKVSKLLDELENKQIKINLFRLHSTPNLTKLYLNLDKGQNNKIQIEQLKKMLNFQTFPWISRLRNLTKGTYVSGIETRFDGTLYIRGLSSKSSRIFTLIFPKIRQITYLNAPFFQRGTYKDYNCGRMINYTIKCSWSSAIKQTSGNYFSK